MKHGFIKQQIIKSCVGTLFLCVIGVAITGGIGYFAHSRNALFNGGFWGVLLGIVVSLIELSLVIWFVDSSKTLGNLTKSETYEDLSKMGDVEKTISQIEQEVASPACEEFKELVVTPSCVMVRKTWKFQIIPTSEVAWIYEFIEGTRSSTQYSLHIFTLDGTQHTVWFGRLKGLSNGFVAVLNACPWALAGYNNKAIKQWTDNQSGMNELAQQRAQEHNTHGRILTEFRDMAFGDDDVIGPLGKKRTQRGQAY